MDARTRTVADELIVDAPDEGRFDIARRLFADPEVFEQEMTHIYENNWVFLAHESQLPAVNDFYTTRIGRQPVLLMRAEDGQVRAFLNACRHRGAAVEIVRRGNKRTHMCPYHGWVYDSTGRCTVDAADKGDYPASFVNDDHNLRAVARVETYRGFIFGSLNADVPALADHLGPATQMIDLFVDASPQGLEVLPGRHSYTCRANWKIQLENIDGYHFFPTHASYVGLIVERMKGASKHGLKTLDLSQLDALPAGAYDLGNGHVMDWGEMPNAQNRPLAVSRERLQEQYGDRRARWMVDRVRNVVLFPNLLLMDNASTTLRIIHPLGAGLTQCETFCIAPVGEDPKARALRLRQYEDFLGPAGMATPDDQAVMERCQIGFAAREVPWQQGYVRGWTREQPGADAEATAAGLGPLSSGSGDTELFCHGMYRRWRELMNASR